MIYSGDVLVSILDKRVNRKLNLYMRSAGESNVKIAAENNDNNHESI
jgi:hypothetical protein